MSIARLVQGSDNSQPNLQGHSPDVDGVFSGLSLEEILRILWRQYKVIIGTVGVVMVISFVGISSLTPRYVAEVLVEINPRQTQVVDFEAVLSGLPADSETIQTEIEIIKSRKIAQRAVTRLELNRDPEFNPNLRVPGIVASYRQTLTAWLASQIGPTEIDDSSSETVPPADEEASPAIEEGPPAQPTSLMGSFLRGVSEFLSPTNRTELSTDDRVRRETEQVINVFLSKLSVEPHGRSRIVKIFFESENAEEAAEVANVVADFYIVAQLEAKFEATKRATTWLGERVERLREEVTVKEEAIEEYRARSGLLQGGREATLTSEQVSELNSQHVLELTRLAEARARLRQVKILLNSEGAVESSIDVLESGLIRDLRREESRVERALAEFSIEYGERHPTMVGARAELRDLRHKIDVEVDRIVQGLRNEVAVAQARAESLSAALENVKKEIAQLNQAEVQLRALEREATASRTLLEILLQRTKQTASQDTFQEADATVVSYAATPTASSFPRKKVFLAFAFFGALFLGVGVAFALESLDFGFRSSEQVERILGVRSLGLLPSVSKLSSKGRPPYDYILERPESAFGQAVRSLYTNLLLSDTVKRPKVILIASALPREGKSTVAVALARMLSYVGRQVLVVDCDLRRPTLHSYLGMKAGPGLTDCLTANVPPEDVIQVDEASGAHVLRSGTPIHDSPEQLDSELMQKLLRHLGRKYDLVILDSSPILAVSDALFVARLADKTVFLTRWARTRRASAQLALRQIREAHADVAGVILNLVDVKSLAQYGYGDSGVYHGTLKKYYSS